MIRFGWCTNSFRGTDDSNGAHIDLQITTESNNDEVVLKFELIRNGVLNHEPIRKSLKDIFNGEQTQIKLDEILELLKK